MQTPICPRCKTDYYLKVTSRTYGAIETRTFRTSHRSIEKRQPVDGVVEFFCQRCGHFNGHSVDDSWELRETASQQELGELGSWYRAPGEKCEVMENGTIRISMRM